MKTASSRFGILVTLLLAATSLNASNAAPDVIGEVIDLSIHRGSPSHSGQLGRAANADSDIESDADLVWSTSLSFPDADYIAPHFSHFDVPMGAYVVVRSPDGIRSWTYRGRGKDALSRGEGFWGVHIYGTTAIVELYSTRPIVADSVVIDRFARGFSAEEMARDKSVINPLSLCSTDDSLWAKCYQTSEPNAYNKARAVARLMINGTGACTGWLVGNQGHVITNEHCITAAADATNTTFEFLAEGATCATSCATWGGCPGTIAATTSTLIKNSTTFDYALVKLPTNLSGTYGFMQLRSTGAVVNERIYIPQHPAAWGKKIAMKDGTANATIGSLNQPPCAGGTSDVGYNADTQGGSSGSPVLGYGDNLVVALHHCGTCPNRAVPIQSVISDLGALLPAGSLPGAPPVNTPPTVSISSPASGSTVTGSTTVSASANDDVAVTKVEFYLDGTLQSTDTTSPFSWSWAPTSA
ncbi:MAG: Ig-like domain-containing protein, partial [Thermoanaerobaculia bacterium]